MPGGVTSVPAAAVVAGDVHGAVVGPRPDDARLQHRLLDVVEDGEVLFAGHVDGDRRTRDDLSFGGEGGEVRRDGLPVAGRRWWRRERTASRGRPCWGREARRGWGRRAGSGTPGRAGCARRGFRNRRSTAPPVPCAGYRARSGPCSWRRRCPDHRAWAPPDRSRNPRGPPRSTASRRAPSVRAGRAPRWSSCPAGRRRGGRGSRRTRPPGRVRRWAGCSCVDQVLPPSSETLAPPSFDWIRMSGFSGLIHMSWLSPCGSRLRHPAHVPRRRTSSGLPPCPRGCRGRWGAPRGCCSRRAGCGSAGSR